MQTLTEETVETAPQTETYRLDPGDHERFAHVVYTQGRKAEAVITEARVLGLAVTALCGKTWVPSRDPEMFPLCPECKQIRRDITGGAA